MKCCGHKMKGSYCSVCGKPRPKPEIFGSPIITIIFVGIIFLGSFLLPGWVERSRTHSLCLKEAIEQLALVKHSPRETGMYEFDSDTVDVWGNKLHVELQVEPLSNAVVVTSPGKDKLLATDDDISEGQIDVHVRKSVAKGIEEGARSAGRGLTKGIKEGILGTDEERAAKKAAKKAAKEKNPGFFARLWGKDANTNG